MNIYKNFSKKIFFLMIPILLLQNSTIIYCVNNQQQPATSYSVWSNLTTLGAGTLTDVSQLSTVLGNIQGTSFATGTDSLYAISTLVATISQQMALNQVIAAAINPAILCTFVGPTNAADFNTKIGTVFTDLQAALITPNHTNITAAQSAITAALAVDIEEGGDPTTTYHHQAVTGGLEDLYIAVTNWLTFYPS